MNAVLDFPRADREQLGVSKHEAHNDSSTEATAKPATVWLSLGANLGDREGTLREALIMISALPATRCITISSLYSTAPVGYTEQPEFLNCAACVETGLPPLELLYKLQRIEIALGRKPRTKWHEREIDIDMLLYDDLTLDHQDLVLPHPEMHKRGFVLVPMSEITPDLQHPTLNCTIQELLSALEDQSSVEQAVLPSWNDARNNIVGL